MARGAMQTRFIPIIEHLSIEIIHSVEDFYSLKGEWDKLFQSIRNPCVFQHFTWCSTWWKHFGRNSRPFVILAREGGQLVGLAPFYTKKRFGVPELHLMGDLQYLGLLVKDDRVDVPAAIGKALNASFNYGVIFARSCEAGDSAMDVFSAVLKSTNWYESRWVRDISHYVYEQHGYESLLSKKSHKSRYNIKRERRILEKQGKVEILHLKGLEVTAEVIEKLADIQRRSWLSRRGQVPVNSVFWREAILLFSEVECVEVFILTLDTIDVAFILSFHSGKRTYCMYIGFDEKLENFSPGKSLMACSIQSSMDDGNNIYDFLFGDADYKRFWGNRTRFVYSLLYCKGIKPWLTSWFPYRLHATLGRYQFLRSWMHQLRRISRKIYSNRSQANSKKT